MHCFSRFSLAAALRTNQVAMGMKATLGSYCLGQARNEVAQTSAVAVSMVETMSQAHPFASCSVPQLLLRYFLESP